MGKSFLCANGELSLTKEAPPDRPHNLPCRTCFGKFHDDCVRGEAGPCVRCRSRRWGVSKCVPIPGSLCKEVGHQVRRYGRHVHRGLGGPAAVHIRRRKSLCKRITMLRKERGETLATSETLRGRISTKEREVVAARRRIGELEQQLAASEAMVELQREEIISLQEAAGELALSDEEEESPTSSPSGAAPLSGWAALHAHARGGPAPEVEEEAEYSEWSGID